jgi:hypothetical protein
MRPASSNLRARLLFAACALLPLRAPAQTATWLTPTSGTWSDPSNWSTNPSYPNSPSTDALLTATGSPYTITLNSPISLNSLTGSSPDATLKISSTLSLTSSLNLGPGSLSLAGNITGGTISSNLTGSGTLTSTTLASTLTLSNFSAVTLAPNFFLAPTGSIHLTTQYSRATLAGSYGASNAGTLSGNGEVVFDDTSGYGSADLAASGNVPTTIGPNITVRTGLGSGTVGADTFTYTTIPLVNQGTISAQTPGQILNIFANGLTNTGTIQATNNSTLRLWGTFSTTALSSIYTTNGGVAYFQTGTIGPLLGGNSSASYTLSASHATGIGMDAVLLGVNISSSDGTPLTVHPYINPTHPVPTGTATLTSCNVLAPISILPGATLFAPSGDTFAGAITANAATLTLSYFSLPASLSLTNSSILNLTGTPTTTSTGSISLTDSTANISAPISPASITASGSSTINLAASLTNTGKTISLSPSSNLIVTTGGSITGGTLSGNVLLKTSGFSNLTYAGTLTIVNGEPSVGALTLSNAHVSLAPSSYLTGMVFTSLTGSGDISFDGSLSNSTIAGSFTLPAAVSIHTGSQSGSVSCSTLAGTISAQTAGQSINLNVSTKITGTLEAKNASSITLTNTSVAPFTGTLSSLSIPSGTYNIYDNSSILFSTSTNKITSLASPASVTLSGPNSSFPALNSLSSNAGSFTLTNGRSFTTQSSFTNTGSLTLGPSSSLKITGSLSNPGSLILAGGALLIDYSSTSPIDDLRNQLLTAHITTPLPNTAIAYAEASQFNFTTYANLPIDSTTLLVITTLPGDANLDGKINADDYTLLDRSFAQNLPNPHWTNGDFNYDGVIDQQDYLLIDRSFYQAQGFSPGFLSERESQFGPAYVTQLLTSIPEPSLLAACGLALLFPRIPKKLRPISE